MYQFFKGLRPRIIPAFWILFSNVRQGLEGFTNFTSTKACGCLTCRALTAFSVLSFRFRVVLQNVSILQRHLLQELIHSGEQLETGMTTLRMQSARDMLNIFPPGLYHIFFCTFCHSKRKGFGDVMNAPELIRRGWMPNRQNAVSARHVKHIPSRAISFDYIRFSWFCTRVD
jgi:hypothetical protein